MATWKLVYTKQARKDAKKTAAAGFKPKAEALLKILERDPFQRPPPFEKLLGDLAGAYSRINMQHRLVYQVLTGSKTVKVIPPVDALRVNGSQLRPLHRGSPLHSMNLSVQTHRRGINRCQRPCARLFL